MRELRIPGLALGIVQGDRIVHLKGFGKADGSGRAVTPQTPFHMASIGKSFTALAVLQLVEAGKVDLDAPVQRYLPWFRLADEQASAQLTVRHLLNQTSGISSAASNAITAKRHTGDDAIEQSVRDLRTVTLQRPVGAAYEYANINYVTLGLIVQTVSGQPFAQYIQQQIFAPLEMHHAYMDPVEDHARGAATGHAYWFGLPQPAKMPFLPADRPAGADSFIASVEDMSHYLIAQLNGGSYGETQVLSPEGIASLHSPAVPTDKPGDFYAMGWELSTMNGVPVVHHGGDVPNFISEMVLIPEGRWGVVVLMNGLPSLRLATGDRRITMLAPGVVGLLYDRPPSDQSASSGIWLVYAILLLLLVIQFVGVGRSARRLWRWHSGSEQPLRGRRAVLWIGLPLALNLGWGLAILVGIPAILGVSRQIIGEYYPDLVAVLSISAVAALGWSLLRTGLAVAALRATGALSVARVPRG